MVPLRCRRLGLASIILVAVLLISPVLAVHASWVSVLQAPIQAVSGAVLGTATFTGTPAGSVMIHVTVRGFDPVAGSHRVAIANVGACCPPAFVCAGSEVLVLPEMQYLSDGSAEYATVTTNLTMDWLRQAQGSAIVIHADTSPTSAVIGCGVISPANTTTPPMCPPAPRPPHVGPGGPGHPVVHPPAPVRVSYRVVASAGLRLRAGAGTQYAVLRIVPLGTIVEGTGAEEWGSGMLWARVRYNGLYYWAARQYLQAW
jgi:Cu/Zn superoxide dismutase